MSWLIIRLFIEICGGTAGIGHTFGEARTLDDVIATIRSFDDLQLVGVLVLGLIAVGGLVELVLVAYRAYCLPKSRPKKSPSKKKKPAKKSA